MDYFVLGPTPADEECAQVGKPNYLEKTMKDGARYIRLLKKLFPIPKNSSISYTLKAFPHDFGTYHEVVVNYDASIEKDIKFACHVEGNLPLSWKG